MTPDLWFAIPGDLATLTGGYAYDRALLASLQAGGMRVAHLPLAGAYPNITTAERASADNAFAALPDEAVVLVDGLALGVLPELAWRHGQRLRLIALCHHPLALETGLSPAAAARLAASEHTALASTRAVVVTSPGTAALLCADYGLTPERILVALPGCMPRPLAPCNGAPLRLLTVATLTPRKGHDVLITALAQLRELPWHARWVGGAHFDPPWSAALRAQVARLELSGRIDFVGELTDVSQEYHQADVFILPSRFEGYGMVFAEALAAGLPIIGTQAGAIPDVVPSTAGLLVAPDDSTALAAALAQVLTQPALRQQLQAGAQAAALQLPRWADTAQRVATLITQVKI